MVENLFRRIKAVMHTRPIFHSSDAAIRGHVFCSFLALAMQKYLEVGDAAALSGHAVRHRERAKLDHRIPVPDRSPAGVGRPRARRGR